MGTIRPIGRLGDDVLAVLDALKLDKPVLAGHSIAGEELSSVGTRYPERVAGLIYLDAGYSYAYYDRSLGNYQLDLPDLQRKLDQLQPGKGPRDLRPTLQELLKVDLPKFERLLEDLQKGLEAPPIPFPPPSTDDLKTFAGLHSWVLRVRGLNYPEAELRQTFETKPDGGVAFDKLRVHPGVGIAITTGMQKFTDIRVPILAIYAVPHYLGPYANSNSSALETYEANDKVSTEAQAKAFEDGIRSARVVRIPRANHLVFLSNEADVLREMRTFLAGLR